MTLRVGLPDDQLYLAGMEDTAPESPGDVVKTVLECLEAFNAKQEMRLRELIPEDVYRRNFVALARQLAPDGERVKLVGLTSQDVQSTRKVALDRPRTETFFETIAQAEGEIIEVVGLLLFANATSRRNMIRVVDDAGEQHPFAVPAEMMGDIVRPLWETRVKAIGIRKGKRKVELRDIEPFAPPPSSKRGKTAKA